MQVNPDGDPLLLDEQPKPDPSSKLIQWRHWLIDIIETILMSLALFLVINLLTTRIEIESGSMRTTLLQGDLVVVSKISYWMDRPQRGDIVMFEPPFDSSDPYIKRVIGLPGDEVSVNTNGVFVNGVQLNESYVQSDMFLYGPDIWNVTDGMLFMMGDNRNNSSDSRVWGLMPMDNIIGKAVFVYWPPSQWGALSSSVLAAEPH